VQDAIGGLEADFGEQRINFGRFTRLTMCEAVSRYWPDEASRPAPEEVKQRGAPRRLLEAFNAWAGAQTDKAPLHAPADSPDGAIIALLFESVAEGRLVQPTMIYDFPAVNSPLAKKREDDPEWVERFEVFIGGMEICNAYSELNDPADQLQRFLEQLQARERGDQEAHLLDADYVRALSYGMPPTAGYGLGIDRLTMLVTNSRSIREVILFPLLRPENPAELKVVDWLKES
jgi:lysyl-tRNA synthetase class 2